MDQGANPKNDSLTINGNMWLNEYMSKTKTHIEGPTVKTTVELPESLWTEAKIFAMRQTPRGDLRSTIIAALTHYLKAQGNGKSNE